MDCPISGPNKGCCRINVLFIGRNVTVSTKQTTCEEYESEDGTE
jgi:hypothetical protein